MLILPLDKLLSPVPLPPQVKLRYHSLSSARASRKENLTSRSPTRHRDSECSPAPKICLTSRLLEDPLSSQKKFKRKKRLMLHSKLVFTHEDLGTLRFDTRDEARKRSRDTWHDPKKVLIYDNNPLNRQKAAKRICDLIVKQVTSTHKIVQFMDYNSDSEVSPQHSEEGSDQDIDGNRIRLPTLKSRLGKYKNLEEKLSMIPEINQEIHYSKTARSSQYNISPLKLDQPELINQTSESLSHDSSYILQTQGKLSTERVIKDLSELLKPPFASKSLSETFVYMHNELKNSISNLPFLLSFLNKNSSLTLHNKFCSILESKKASFVQETHDRYSFSSIKVNLPSCDMLPTDLIYMISSYTRFSCLMHLNIRDNPKFGDTAISTLTLILTQFCPSLIHYDISYTGAGRKAAVAMQILLSKKKSGLQRLGIGRNVLGDEGLVDLANACSKSTTLRSLDLQYLHLDSPTVSEISKIIRFCKSLRYLNISGNLISGESFRHITRAIIINRQLRCISMNDCHLDDIDMRELYHSLKGNPYLRSIDLCKNSISKKGLNYILDGLLKSSRLVHLGLQENKINLAQLEQFKQQFPTYKEIEITRDSDFRSSQYFQQTLGKILKYFN
jgi:Ran GTPase-activating protein (RanGAP) involved in mRNA processing and transport